ncbi:hypothetical protein GGH12_001538 [Coemansia sp. RSA 1822]|nr:hypothetical protein LPJ76_001816 [Coemansia sp. RSA 638]KAJ2544468.1 hypothetical protein GGF49_001217 [Coemansia sp. RSA 1853]KAJ2565235.1 hypothetical protein GGH12_001538 [Coemansia sp. RSA 1822]
MGADSLNLAQSYAKDAQKASKSSWLSKPQWDIAATNWDKAANAFKTALHYEEAVDSHVQASEAYVKVNIIFLAAKGYEEAATLAERQLGDTTRAITYYTRASDLYRSQGSSADRAASMMVKAASVCSDIDSNKTTQLYESAISIYETEDRMRFSIPTFKLLAKFLIHKSRLSDAARVYERLGDVCVQLGNRPELAKSYLSAVVLVLAFGDGVEAGKKLDAFAQSAVFVRSNEGTVGNAMVEAFESGDQEGFDELARDQAVSFLDGSVSRLAMQIRVPGGRRAMPTDPADPALPRTDQPNDIDDDDLC